MPLWPDDARKTKRYCPRVLRLALCGALIAQALPAAAQTVGDPAAQPAPTWPVLTRLAPSGRDIEGGRGRVFDAQFMPGMPQMAQMPPMMAPMQGGSQGSMGGGMAMVMTGDTIGEMMAGACTAGLFIGGIAAAAAMGPAAPLSASVVANSAGVGCGFAMAATAAGMAGMEAWRAVYSRFK